MLWCRKADCCFFDGPENLVFVRWYKKHSWYQNKKLFLCNSRKKVSRAAVQLRPDRLEWQTIANWKNLIILHFHFLSGAFLSSCFSHSPTTERESRTRAVLTLRERKIFNKWEEFSLMRVFRSGEKRKSYSHLKWIDTCRERLAGGHLHDSHNRFFNASESLTITTWSPTVLGMNYKLNVYLVMPFSTQHHEGWGFGFWLLVKSTLAAAMQFT